jgi:predicted ribosome quality control (RQC) complex YloA/Tae2 family protein
MLEDVGGYSNELAAVPVSAVRVMVDEIEELRQEREHLRMAAESEAKRGDELAARVERLERVSNWVHNPIYDDDGWDRLVEFNCEVYAESLPASLKLHDADVLEKFAESQHVQMINPSQIESTRNYTNLYGTVRLGRIRAAAAKLRQEATP